MIDLRLLRYFVAIAETENVGRAAEKLHISQSPLSRQMIQFESQLGLSLFERSKQRLRLTADGRDFLIQARALIASADDLESHVRRVGRGESGKLEMGYVEGAINSGVLPNVLRRLAAAKRDIRFELKSMRSGEQIELLRKRQLDLAFVHSPPFDDSEIDQRLALKEDLLLAIADDHPLAEIDITPLHLDALPWIAFPQKLSPATRSRFLATCGSLGFQPDIRFEASEPSVVLGLVSAGLGAAFVQRSAARVAPQGVSLIHLPWFPMSVEIYVAWRRADTRTLVRAIVENL
jgi:DNA-binding transcriptional LysR family regulator